MGYLPRYALDCDNHNIVTQEVFSFICFSAQQS